MSTITKSIVVGLKSTESLLQRTPYSRSQDLFWNPFYGSAFSKFKNIEIGFLGLKTSVKFGNEMKRNSFAVYASTLPDAPLPSTPPASGSIKSWILGMVLSVILPFFSNKWGPLWVLKNRIENAVQTVEYVVEAVEKVAEEVDKIAEDIADDLPEGNLKKLVTLVEDVAEKIAKSADSLDNLIDKVQEAEEKVECIVDSMIKEGKNSPQNGAKDQ